MKIAQRKRNFNLFEYSNEFHILIIENYNIMVVNEYKNRKKEKKKKLLKYIINFELTFKYVKFWP